LAAEEIGLDGDFIASFPIFNFVPDCHNPTGNFAAECARKLDGNRKSGRFSPEVDVV
jgi:hypothetical protein